MRAKHWLIGCILCIAGSGGAMASSWSAQDMGNATRTVTDSSSSQRDGAGDVTELTARNGIPRANTRDTTGNSPSGNNDHTGSGDSAPAPIRQPHLGWQSLLPGSIQ
ncbi:MAG TPA: hypothetical protein VGC19_06390 [Rhodanobacter sp.]